MPVGGIAGVYGGDLRSGDGGGLGDSDGGSGRGSEGDHFFLVVGKGKQLLESVRGEGDAVHVLLHILLLL